LASILVPELTIGSDGTVIKVNKYLFFIILFLFFLFCFCFCFSNHIPEVNHPQGS